MINQNAWALEFDSEEPGNLSSLSRAEKKRVVFAKIGELMDQDLGRSEVEQQLLRWVKETQISDKSSQILRILDWAYRNWDM